MNEPTHQNPTHHRRRFFLPDSSQPRLLIGIELIFLILLVVSSTIFCVVTNRDLTTSYFQAHLQIKNLQELFLPVLVLVNLGGLILGAVLSIFFTHRVAGPVYRLCHILRQVGQGNLNQVVQFRAGDELKELDRATSEMLVALNQRLLRLKGRAILLRTQADALPTAAGTPAKQIEFLRDATVALEQELAAFELAPEKKSEQS